MALLRGSSIAAPLQPTANRATASASPPRFPREWLLAQCGLSLDESSPLGVGVVFLPEDDTAQRAEIESALFEQDMEVLTWRPVPDPP